MKVAKVRAEPKTTGTADVNAIATLLERCCLSDKLSISFKPHHVKRIHSHFLKIRASTESIKLLIRKFWFCRSGGFILSLLLSVQHVLLSIKANSCKERLKDGGLPQLKAEWLLYLWISWYTCTMASVHWLRIYFWNINCLLCRYSYWHYYIKWVRFSLIKVALNMIFAIC